MIDHSTLGRTVRYQRRVIRRRIHALRSFNVELHGQLWDRRMGRSLDHPPCPGEWKVDITLSEMVAEFGLLAIRLMMICDVRVVESGFHVVYFVLHVGAQGKQTQLNRQTRCEYERRSPLLTRSISRDLPVIKELIVVLHQYMYNEALLQIGYHGSSEQQHLRFARRILCFAIFMSYLDSNWTEKTLMKQTLTR
jgi:hypothetical protein